MLQDVIQRSSKPVKQQEVKRYLMGHYDVSQRRACPVVNATRSQAYYRSPQDPLTALRLRMRGLAQARARFGIGGCWCCGARAGRSAKRAFYRVYTAEGLTLRRKRPWRRATAVPANNGSRPPGATTSGAWITWPTSSRTAAISHLDRAGSLHARVLGHRGGARPHGPGRRRYGRDVSGSIAATKGPPI
jgi:hypothetical protein